MIAFADLLRPDGTAGVLFVPTAILLGALHGLEPGHAKTLMAAFIVAVRGTVGQAVLLGLAATLSHTILVWAVALGGMYAFSGLDIEGIEPYFQLITAALVFAIGLWMIRRAVHAQRAEKETQARAAAAARAEPALRQIDTGHGLIGLALVPAIGTPGARFQLRTLSGEPWEAGHVTIATTAPDGQRKSYRMAAADGYLQSVETVPEPHRFTASIIFEHHDHQHTYNATFGDGAGDAPGSGVAEPLDAHARSHAEAIRTRFANRTATTGQIVMFGLTGGLIPCPAAITVLLLCLQVKRLAQGAALVLAFSLGLALTLMAAGVIAALGVQHLSRRFSGFDGLGARAPYLSGGLIILMGLYLGIAGLYGLAAAGAI